MAVENADSRIDALLGGVAPGDVASVLLIAAMEWDDGDGDCFSSEGVPAQDFFTRMAPFVAAREAEEDRVAKELFEEAVVKPDEQALEEVGFLQRSFVIEEGEASALRAATPAHRKRMLFVVLLKDSEQAHGADDAGEDSDAAADDNGG